MNSIGLDFEYDRGHYRHRAAGLRFCGAALLWILKRSDLLVAPPATLRLHAGPAEPGTPGVSITLRRNGIRDGTIVRDGVKLPFHHPMGLMLVLRQRFNRIAALLGCPPETESLTFQLYTEPVTDDDNNNPKGS